MMDYETIEHEGYKIKISSDVWWNCDEINPLKHAAHEVEYIGKKGYGQSLQEHGSFSISDFSMLTKEQIHKNKNDIKKLLQIEKEKSLFIRILEECRDTCNNDALDAINNLLVYEFDSLNDSGDRAIFIEAFFEIAGYNVHNTTIRGNNQGDWYNICLADKELTKEQLEQLTDNYKHWAFGNIYEYSILKSNICQCCSHEELELVGSCGGFLSDDHEKSGLIESAKAEIDALIKNS